MAGTDAAHTDASAPPPQFVAQGHQNPCPCGADGMAIGNSAAVGIHLLEHLFFGHSQNRAGADDGHGREGLVDFDYIELIDGHVVLVENFLDGKTRNGGDILRRLGDFGVIEDSEEGLHSQLVGHLPAHQHTDVAAVVDAGGIARRYTAKFSRHGALVIEDGGQFRQTFDRRPWPWSFVLVKNNDFFSLLYLHGEDLVVEPTRFHGRDGPGLRLVSPLVLILAGEAELIGRFGTVNGHVAVVEGVPKPVVNHQVYQTSVRESHAVSPTHIRKRIWAVAHALLAAGDNDFGPTGLNHLNSEVNGFDSRRANLVDGDRGDAFRQTSQQGGLTAGNLAAARRHNLAHDDIINILAFDLAARSPQAFLDGQRPKLGGVKALQGAAKHTVGRPASLDTDHFPQIFKLVFDFFPHARKIGFSLPEFCNGSACIILFSRLVQLLWYLFHVLLLI